MRQMAATSLGLMHTDAEGLLPFLQPSRAPGDDAFTFLSAHLWFPFWQARRFESSFLQQFAALPEGIWFASAEPLATCAPHTPRSSFLQMAAAMALSWRFTGGSWSRPAFRCSVARQALVSRCCSRIKQKAVARLRSVSLSSTSIRSFKSCLFFFSLERTSLKAYHKPHFKFFHVFPILARTVSSWLHRAPGGLWPGPPSLKTLPAPSTSALKGP